MLLATDLVNDSARRNKKRKELIKLEETLGEGDRSRRVPPQTRENRFRALMDQVGDPVTARTYLERVLGGNDLVGVNYLSIGASRARAVCRVHLKDAAGVTVGFGTGFLIGPGVLMTNHHVISGADEARNSLAEFDYEYDAAGDDKPVAAFRLVVDPEPIAYQPLDFCLVGVSPRSIDGKRSLDEFGWLTLNPTPGKAIVGEYLTIIQHPGGERKQVCVRENKLLKYDENGSTLWYQTDTVAGSSGSPVFNQVWDVVALHHSGIPETDAQGHWLAVDGKPWDPSMGENRIQWVANEGVRISTIVEYVRTRKADEVVARPIVSPRPSPVETKPDENGAGHDGWATTVVNDELHMTIPVRVAVRLGGGTNLVHVLGNTAASDQHAAEPASLPGPVVAVPSGIESVSVDQTNYDERTGYQPDFLGTGELLVPLPTVEKASLHHQVVTAGAAPNGELKYWTYSVVMNKSRQLAFFSASNVDAERRPKSAGRDGDRWFTDTRIDAKFQLDGDFYGRQREFEVDRSQNPFDRGHLTRRLDAQWGFTAAKAKRNGDDSFHWTNCSPQHYRFNQGSKLWLGLEDYVIDTFADDGGRRASVINGPVFDAPLSSLDPGGRVVPNLKGKSHKDPVFGDSGVAIPKLFFKVVACLTSEGELVSAAFLMSQEELLVGLDRLTGMPSLPEEKLTNAEARLYQVSISDLGGLVGLDFGPLGSHEVSVQESETALDGRPRPVVRLEDIELRYAGTARHSSLARHSA
jgi:endonuclease G, mitochondrial